ncbi:DUF4082 domain-containing protein [Salipiger mucosus]|uniref:Cadherin domain-containing protein n=1 Tax=Salipiger mucosus DSM 16094 TaxID=1123237 RepID=S9QWG8_9RHOB|nr:DUF4082 domain-containing protein [Salipiger mucosus]EPX85726.1 hypothetical protein Salmuc_04998 [Salipiger mucosus DSM 16094]
MPTNAIVEENARTDGRTPQSYWDVEHSRLIEGFTTEFSINAGDTVDFKINVSDNPGSDYIVEIFRLGYYGGDGARMVGSWTNTDATVQPDAVFIEATGTADAGNWSITDSWDIPAEAVSGVYLARVQRLDANGDPIDGAVNQIPFVVREDDRPADIVLQTSDTTWHAYNGWIGNNGEIGANFYGDASGTIENPEIPGAGGFAQNRAYAVSYNRPFITRGIEGEQGGPAAGAQDYLFGADYAAIRWLEQNGYDVAYMSGIDTDRLGSEYLENYGAFISVGHDEYWSADQRYNVEDARDAGVNLLFWSGNEVYWKTRWETSTIDGQEYRTLVCYKETWAVLDQNAGPEDYVNLDPANIWTGTWRDDRFIGNPLAGDATDRPPLTGQPDLCNCAETSLTGQLFGPDGTGEFGGALDVPEDYASLRFWRDTDLSGTGDTGLSPGILGYEWNTSPDNEYRPAGLVHLSATTLDWSGILVDQGNTVEPGTATHNLSLYRAESGALVFGAGTVFWTWALTDNHDSEPYGANIENAEIQQFVVNLFADMQIQPGETDAVLASQGLVRATASTDVTPASATIDAQPPTVPAGTPVVLTGTATDDDGNPLTDDGAVALVELSFDGGATWRPASGTSTWSYTWSPDTIATQEILVRAIDDSLNLPVLASLQTTVIETTTPESISMFDPWADFTGQVYDAGGPLQLGTRFSTGGQGQITELHYYRAASDADDTDTRTGRLWAEDGTLLATVEFVSQQGESGWQTAVLSTPVDVLAGRTYTVSYETENNYVGTSGFFSAPYSDPFALLTAPSDVAGVYASGSGAIMPTQSFESSSYWVDVTFTPGDIDNEAPIFLTPSALNVEENAVLATVVTADDTDTDALSYTIAGGADAAAFSIDAVTGALSFVYAPDFEAPADADGDNLYEVTVAVTDGFHPSVTHPMQITVTDKADETDDAVWTLFAPGSSPAVTETGDATDYELGTRFTAAGSGEIDSLRYWRGAADASDNDSRVLNLWDGTGTLLASVTVASGPGESGWQVGVLETPVSIASGETYTVSYGTTQNYVVSQGYFGFPQDGPGGMLTGPANAGVYAAGGTGSYPTQSYLGSNYWVDVGFRAGPIVNDPPAFTLAGTAFTAEENQTVAATLTASDPDADTLVFAIAGGADAGAFNISPDTGLLTFATQPDFETPGDVGGDNVYDVIVSVSDGTNPAVQQAITVEVTDIDPEPAPDALSLFGPGDAPAQTETGDSTDYELGVRFLSAEDGEITALRYWRGAADAGDTDTRTLNLWDAGGTLLASATVSSTPGQSGWQTALLAAPVAIDADTLYVASYGTTQNYAFTVDFFGTAWTGSEGILSAPAASAGNGVFSSGATGIFPEYSFNAANYWVDVIFDPADALL